MQYTKMLSFITQKLKDMSDTTVDLCLNSTMASAIEFWGALYEDRAPWISARKGIHSAGIAGAIAAEMARLVTLEHKSEVQGNNYVNDVYKKVLKDLRVQTEYAGAKGGLIFKPYPTNDGISVQYIRADCFFPISFDSSGNITRCVFVEQLRKGKQIYTRLEIHAIENDTLKVQNFAFLSQSDQALGTQIDLTTVDTWADIEPEASFPGVSKLPIGYFKIPLANTIDPDSPLGVSVFSRAAGLIKEADCRYSNICWEYEATQAAIHISESLLERDKSGNLKYPEGKERLYRAFNYASGVVDKPLLDKFSPDIRSESLYAGYQGQLKLIEFVCGLAYGTLSDPQTTDKTAEEIRSSKQRSYATVTDIQMALQTALTDLAEGIAFWANAYNYASKSEIKMTFEWDDSIVVDSNAVANRAMLEYGAGIIDAVRYFEQVYGMTTEAAQKLATEISARAPAPTQTDFFNNGAGA